MTDKVAQITRQIAKEIKKDGIVSIADASSDTGEAYLVKGSVLEGIVGDDLNDILDGSTCQMKALYYFDGKEAFELYWPGVENLSSGSGYYGLKTRVEENGWGLTD